VSKAEYGIQQGLDIGGDMLSAIPGVGSIAGGVMGFLGKAIGLTMSAKQDRYKQAAMREAQKKKQLGQLKAITGDAVEQNSQTVAGGGTLPLPSPPVAKAAPFQLPAPPQVQLQQPQFGAQQQNPLGGMRNNYMMKLLMQGDR